GGFAVVRNHVAAVHPDQRQGAGHSVADFAAAGDRHAIDAAGGHLLGGGHPIVPGLGRVIGVEAGLGVVVEIVDQGGTLDTVGDAVELALVGVLRDHRLVVIVAVLDGVVERQHQIVLGIALHPAVLHLDD